MRYSPFRHLGSIFRAKDPIQLTVFLTRRCNAKCSFCFYLSREGEDNPKELSLDEFQKISSSIGNLLWLAFSGGEIFLREDLVEIVSLFYRNNKPAIILLPTNGLLPEKIYRNTEAILKNCPNSTVTVKLSLDGPENIHDKLRGVEGAFNKVLFCYQTLAPLLKKYRNFELGINTVFCAENQDRMTETIKLVRGLKKIRAHTVSLIRGEVGDENLKKVEMDKYKAASKLLEDNLKKSLAARYSFPGAVLKAAQDIVQRKMIYRTTVENSCQLTCQAGRLTAVITETGDVYPCESFQDKLGNLRASGYDLPQILGNEKSREVKADIKKNRCYCTHECNMMMNILFNPGQYPALFREYARLQAGPPPSFYVNRPSS